MLQLDRVTLICVDCLNYGAAISAIKKSMAQCKFKKVLFLTNVDIKIDGVETVLIRNITSKQDYSYFMMKELYQYITTEFIITIQHDGYVINGGVFPNELYDYDYAGALWLETDGYANGNGGVSWRSKKLIHAVAKDSFINSFIPEDVSICRVYRNYLEVNYGLKWATDEICERFSFELRVPYQETFAFHSYFHPRYKPMVVIQRQAALGDTISTEPVLAYFHKKGYQVVLDTLPQFEELFYRHYFPVLFPSQVDAKQLEYATKYNLDMSYESKPKENRLKTYYEFCGITDGEMVSPKLSLGFDAAVTQRLFIDKYVVIHMDKMSHQPYRKVEGIHWDVVSALLKVKGYNVIQVGGGEHVYIEGALEVNTVNLMLLMYAVAGAELFIGIDSGVSHVASGFNIPSIIFFGSVNSDIAHADKTNKICLDNHQGEGVCNKPYCYHESITTVGQDCYLNKGNPPCTNFTTEQLINAINTFI